MAEAIAAPVTVAADTPDSTPGGATFTVPAGFTVVRGSGRATLTGPETDLRVVIADSAAATPDEAVISAWKTLHADFVRPIKVTQPYPGRDGWEEQRDYDYETSPNERVIVRAQAFRRGKAWTVLLIEGGEGSIEKRGASVRMIGKSLRPKGYERETFAGKTPHKLDAALIQQIISAVEKGRTLTGIPGLGLALVQDGKVVYEGGLGVRELGKPEKVTANTRFMIASNTKALTTLLLAKLVDEGKLGWETPVTKVYPAFKLGDADTTRQVLVKHLICACTGVPRQDFEWLFGFAKQTPRSEMELLGTMQPTTKFGETFQYSNALAAAAGFVAGYALYPQKELGAAYDEAMQSRVFGPLGMTDTTLDFDRGRRGDFAMPHEVDVDGKMAPAVMDLNRSATPVRPAGAAWSTVHDVSKYVAMELANGMQSFSRTATLFSNHSRSVVPGWPMSSQGGS